MPLSNKKSSFIVYPPMRFLSAVPDVETTLLQSAQPKVLKFPFDPIARFVTYRTTSLEKNYKHPLLTERNLGVHIDLINPIQPQPNTADKKDLDPADLELLEVPRATNKRSKEEMDVTWLLKTEYMAGDDDPFLRRKRRRQEREQEQQQFDEDEEKQRDANFTASTAENQIRAIDRTFVEASKLNVQTLKHRTKPHLKATNVIPIFPDFFLWPNVYTQVHFDADPIPAERYTKEYTPAHNVPFISLDHKVQQEIRKSIPGNDKLFKDAIILQQQTNQRTSSIKESNNVAYLLPKQRAESNEGTSSSAETTITNIFVIMLPILRKNQWQMRHTL
jgi:hypothetical protein